MKNKSFWLPHLLALVLFIVLGAVYFAPQLEGYELNQGDIRQHIGMSKEISDYRELEKRNHYGPIRLSEACPPIRFR
ncbi:MAG: hypothetical protein HC905_11945 [Bacteroidales bacterium]|nr:hypothetical protein [Bacteroidales bacterium]